MTDPVRHLQRFRNAAPDQNPGSRCGQVDGRQYGCDRKHQLADKVRQAFAIVLENKPVRGEQKAGVLPAGIDPRKSVSINDRGLKRLIDGRRRHHGARIHRSPQRYSRPGAWPCLKVSQVGSSDDPLNLRFTVPSSARVQRSEPLRGLA